MTGSWLILSCLCLLLLNTSYVSQFILFYFERILEYKPYRYLWILYREYVECADATVQRRSKI